IAETNSKNLKPSSSRAIWNARFHWERSMRTHRSTPGSMWESRTASSPSSSVSWASTASRTSSVSAGVSSAVVSVSADDNRITSPLLGHVLVGDPLLEQDHAFEQGLGPGRAAGHVHV